MEASCQDGKWWEPLQNVLLPAAASFESVVCREFFIGSMLMSGDSHTVVTLMPCITSAMMRSVGLASPEGVARACMTSSRS